LEKDGNYGSLGKRGEDGYDPASEDRWEEEGLRNRHRSRTGAISLVNVGKGSRMQPRLSQDSAQKKKTLKKQKGNSKKEFWSVKRQGKKEGKRSNEEGKLFLFP